MGRARARARVCVCARARMNVRPHVRVNVCVNARMRAGARAHTYSTPTCVVRAGIHARTRAPDEVCRFERGGLGFAFHSLALQLELSLSRSGKSVVRGDEEGVVCGAHVGVGVAWS